MRRLPNTYPGDITKYPTKRGTFSIGSADEGSKVLFYNETPVNLDLDFYNGNTDVLHAWEANFWTLDGEVGDITWAIDTDSLTVTNPPINAVFATVLNPNETLRDKAYPMPLIRQIGGQQAIVSGATSLSNESNPANTLVVDIGDAALSQLWKIFTDHFSISVDQSGVAHTVLQGNTAGNPLKLGQVGDTTEVLGNLLVAGATWNLISGVYSSMTDMSGNNAFVSGTGDTFFEALTGHLVHIQCPNTIDVATFGEAGTNILGLLTATGQITGAAAQNLTLNAVTGQHIQFLINNVLVGSIDAAGLNFSSKKLFDTASHNLADWTGSGLSLKGNQASQSGMSYQANGVNTDFKLSCLSFFSGSGSVTANHGMTQFGASQAPDIVVPVVNVAGSATMGFDTVTSTQVHITAGAALGWRAWGMR